jgi:hypothetical protein
MNSRLMYSRVVLERPSSLVKNSSVPWLERELGQVRVVHWTRVLIPRAGSRSPRSRPVRPVPATHRSASSSSESGTGAYGLAYSFDTAGAAEVERIGEPDGERIGSSPASSCGLLLPQCRPATRRAPYADMDERRVIKVLGEVASA